MHLKCIATGLSPKERDALAARLHALAETPIVREDGVKFEYYGVFDQHTLAIIAVFEQFGCDRAIMFSDDH